MQRRKGGQFADGPHHVVVDDGRPVEHLPAVHHPVPDRADQRTGSQVEARLDEHLEHAAQPGAVIGNRPATLGFVVGDAVGDDAVVLPDPLHQPGRGDGTGVRLHQLVLDRRRPRIDHEDMRFGRCLFGYHWLFGYHCWLPAPELP